MVPAYAEKCRLVVAVPPYKASPRIGTARNEGMGLIYTVSERFGPNVTFQSVRHVHAQLVLQPRMWIQAY